MDSTPAMTLKVRGQDVIVDATPLAEAPRSSHRDTTLAERRQNCLVLRPSLAYRLVVTAFLVVGILLGWLAISLGAHFGSLCAGAFSLALIAIGGYGYALAKTYVFDRGAGQFSKCGMVGVKNRSLEHVLAVQLLYGGHKHGYGNTWQMNLVLDDLQQPRCNLSNHSNLKATLRDAARMAEFLRVPLLDQRSQGTQVTVILLGKEVAVPTAPLGWSGTANFRTMTLVQPRPGCLVLQPSDGMRIFASVFVMVGLAAISIGLSSALSGQQGYAFTLSCTMFVGLLFALAGTLLLFQGGRYKFDRDYGRFSRRRYLASTTRPLRDVLAVQIADGGDHEDYHSWQLKLILDDEAERRWILSDHSNLDATKRDGARLAEFLSVPLLDHTKTC